MTEIKNSKKGFTLVELVVVIAILAILAAIAIPVVSNTINTSKISGAASDAQTVELALKEAQAQIVARDTSVYEDGEATTVAEVFAAKGISTDLYNYAEDKSEIDSSTKGTIVIKGTMYNLEWSSVANKCLYVSEDRDVDIQGNALPAAEDTFAELGESDVITDDIFADDNDD